MILRSTAWKSLFFCRKLLFHNVYNRESAVYNKKRRLSLLLLYSKRNNSERKKEEQNEERTEKTDEPDGKKCFYLSSDPGRRFFSVYFMEKCRKCGPDGSGRFFRANAEICYGQGRTS